MVLNVPLSAVQKELFYSWPASGILWAYAHVFGVVKRRYCKAVLCVGVSVLAPNRSLY